MRTVSRFEANLLRILHGFLGRATTAQIKPLVLAAAPRPPCLSRACAALAEDALAKGCVWLLATRGGWRAERYLRDGQPVGGRLWQRTAPEQLACAFSWRTLDFLIWITAENPAAKPPPVWSGFDDPELTTGDLLLLALAYERLREWRELKPWRQGFASHALCRLAFPQDFAMAPPLAPEAFARWTQGPGGCLLEALQPTLADRWVIVEQSKGRVVDPGEMRALGRNQEQTLDALFAALAASGRRDLARFVWLAAKRLLAGDPAPSAWVASLEFGGLRMADRAATYRAAAAFFRGLETLAAWQRHARSVAFWDEDYAAAQLWKADWEQFDGDRLCRQAHAVVRALDPMQTP